ncbi:hypothetical protein [Streptomyces sp. NBC_01217]|uniref:hypothetical protein n=1 Tax=Streptomyces sp. NBC_01217 TaxID=2903779 RepID=UPI002E15A5DA|nr:hypothetical protein OG507_18675 [Streptomyces sp. NBC_01217]
MENRRETVHEAVRGVAGCLVVAAGGAAGMLAWAPYGRRGIFGGFEGESEWNVLLLGLPVMTLGGLAAGAALLALVQGKWRRSLGAAALLAALAGFGVAFDVLQGPPSSCGPDC